MKPKVKREVLTLSPVKFEAAIAAALETPAGAEEVTERGS